eukprot:3280857-Prymnesium_polylepis.1
MRSLAAASFSEAALAVATAVVAAASAPAATAAARAAACELGACAAQTSASARLAAASLVACVAAASAAAAEAASEEQSCSGHVQPLPPFVAAKALCQPERDLLSRPRLSVTWVHCSQSHWLALRSFTQAHLASASCRRPTTTPGTNTQPADGCATRVQVVELLSHCWVDAEEHSDLWGEQEGECASQAIRRGGGGAHHVLVLIVFRGQQVRVPRVLQRAPVDAVAMLCGAHAFPAANAILQLAPLVGATMHLPVAEAGEAGGGGSSAALREKVARHDRGTRCSKRVAILVTEPPAAEADAEDLSEELLSVPHQLQCHAHV